MKKVTNVDLDGAIILMELVVAIGRRLYEDNNMTFAISGKRSSAGITPAQKKVFRKLRQAVG